VLRTYESVPNSFDSGRVAATRLTRLVAAMLPSAKGNTSASPIGLFSKLHKPGPLSRPPTLRPRVTPDDARIGLAGS
jgi:hypothetical protein